MAEVKNPFLYFVTDFEKEAEAFLRKYNCADAIETPRPIPIKGIATKLMSLDVIDTEYLSPDESVQGAITFTKGIIEVYDWSGQEYVGYEIDHPAIFIDADIINPGRYNNTLAHECFHWWKHRNYFNYKRTHENGQEFAFRCNRTNSNYDRIAAQWSDIDKMEWQAKTIAPKILMPRTATKNKIEVTFKKLLKESPGTSRQDVTEMVIDTIAEFFEVSKQSAAIRMLELGYAEAEEYCGSDYNGQPTQQKIKNGTSAAKHQIPITIEEAFELYRYNDALKTTLDTGVFRFADGYFVLNDENYVSEDDTGFHLTDFAKEHLAECTLDFSTRLRPDFFMHSYSYTMFRSDNEYKKEATYNASAQNTELYNKAKEFEKKLKRSQENSITAAEWMKRRMDEEGWDVSTFEMMTDLDKMNYTRVQKGTHKFTLRPLVAMGVGLSLDLDEMNEVLKLAGIAFMDGDTENEAYKFLFTAFHGKPIKECNKFLKKVGVQTLGTHERN